MLSGGETPNALKGLPNLARYWLRARRIFVHTFLHADDTPRQIALGAAVATFIAFLPIVGIQTVVAIALAALLRVNKAICVPIVWITNPATLVPIYTGCYWVGRFVLGQGGHSEFDPEQSLLGPVTRHQGWGRFLRSEFWERPGTHATGVAARPLGWLRPGGGGPRHGCLLRGALGGGEIPRATSAAYVAAGAVASRGRQGEGHAPQRSGTR